MRCGHHFYAAAAAVTDAAAALAAHFSAAVVLNAAVASRESSVQLVASLAAVEGMHKWPHVLVVGACDGYQRLCCVL